MRIQVVAALVAACMLSPAVASADNARDLYTRALAQERTVRDGSANATRAQMRRVVAAYETILRRYPTSGYCDNALWQAGNIAALAYERFGNAADRRTAERLFKLLVSEYPSSRLVADARAAVAALPDLAASAAAAPPRAAAPAMSAPSAPAAARTAAGSGPVILQEIRRSALPDGVRLTVELGTEVAFYQEELANPRRVFFDLKNVKAAPSVQDAALKFDGDLVKEIRLGRHPNNTTRVVVDLDGVAEYSVYPLYGPYRLVMDFRRTGASAPTVPVASSPTAPPAPPSAAPDSATTEAAAPAPLPVAQAINRGIPPAVASTKPSVPEAPSASPLPSSPVPSKALPPAAPAANSNGKFSLSRQLGLRVSRIVIDAGHGGHDPGAHGNGIDEAELTLDVAKRLRALLEKEDGIDVVMTRDSDVYIPLEERTAIANREGADLFLSIHANASRNVKARGVETYFLNFAMNPEAEAVAARENAGSGKAMHSLPDIVKAIALNNKINESRDFAETVQKSMVKRLAARNRALRDLGVKQAPFVVLIGAGMPSVLAEISFVTNKQEGTLLKTSAYRQQIAQALLDAVVKYQQGLKRMTVTAKKATY
jgi:N-acetylmuramoyl-L-alanine amidase